jgi:hypothetical protein
MNLLITSICSELTGMGHYFRALTLAQAAYRLGHQVTFACDLFPQERQPGILTIPLTYQPDNPHLVFGELNGYDWVILDSPSELPPPIKVEGVKLCLIDGVGHEAGQADLVISQGLEGEYAAPEYLILRPELFKPIPNPLPPFTWLVWGGAADKLGLLPAFAQACPDFSAYLLQSEFLRDRVINTGLRQWVVPVKGDELLHWARQCSSAVVAMGMITWELLAARPGLPIYVFSLTDRHLKSALQMEAKGWLKCWPQTSLPDEALMKDWLSESFEPKPVEGLDSQGCERILTLLESQL